MTITRNRMETWARDINMDLLFLAKSGLCLDLGQKIPQRHPPLASAAREDAENSSLSTQKLRELGEQSLQAISEIVVYIFGADSFQSINN